MKYNIENIVEKIETNDLGIDLLLKISETIHKIKKSKLCYKMEQKQKIEYYNISSAFDTETTSTYTNDEKFAFVYEWTFAIGDDIIYGRKIEDFVFLLEAIKNVLNLNNKKMIVIYVHNLSFDFQFIKEYFKWNKIFYLQDRIPIFARTDGFEFRCSYIQSSKSLEKIGEELGINKRVGYLDYSKVRHYNTKLTEEELEYCIYDVHILNEYVKNLIKEEGDISKIPYTNTGYVRRECKKNTLNNKKYKEYIERLKIEEVEYLMLKQAFCGGFTHANINYVDEIIEDVFSFDFESSYPAVMLSEKFPCSAGKRVDIKSDSDIWYYISEKCCLFVVEMTNVKSRKIGDNIISFSKCMECENYQLDNGRIIKADKILLVCNEVDFINFCKFYSFDYKISEMIIYEKDYLPKELIEVIAKLYKDKCELKGIKDKEREYKRSKEMLNSVYGMMVMDIVRNGENIEDAIKKYNNSKTRFNFYAWGVWVTSYARNNLYSAITELGEDYIYSDTDSVKLINIDDHIEYFENYNRTINEKVKECLNHNGIEFEFNKLGIWDREKDIRKFKTLGAKRYLCEYYDGEYNLTCSGISKKYGLDYMKKLNKNIFSVFENGLEIPSEFSGKKTHTYIDYEITGKVKDYLGEEVLVSSKSGVHLENCSFKIGMDDMYIDILLGIKNGYFQI